MSQSPAPPPHYELSPYLALEPLVLALQSHWPRSSGVSRLRLERVFLDSFDWRCFERGMQLELERTGDAARLWLRDEKAAQAVDVEAPPRFVHEIPDPAFAERLQQVVENRALLERVQLTTERTEIVFPGADGKAQARLQLDENSLRLPGRGQHKLLGTRLQLDCSGEGAAVLLHELNQAMLRGLLRRVQEPILVTALRALGRQPLDYSSRIEVALDPHMRADAAAKIILRRLAANLRANEAGVRQDLDHEFLHDYRVAVRRTRSALRQIKRVFPEPVVRRFAGEFAWLGQLTSPPRDLDVLLENFDGYAAGLGGNAAAALEPLRAHLQRERVAARAALVAAMEAERYAELMREWQRFLDTPLPEYAEPTEAMLPVHRVARRRIYRLFRRALREGWAIHPASDAVYLHTLRKTCKKLRYLMEFFQGLYPAERIRPLLRDLKQLQDNLGEFQDLEVHATWIRGFLDRAAGGAEPLLAARELQAALRSRQQTVRTGFDACLAAFAAEANRQAYRELFHRGD